MNTFWEIVSNIANSNAFSTIVAALMGFFGAVGASRLLVRHEQSESRRNEIKAAAIDVVRNMEIFLSTHRRNDYSAFENLKISIKSALIVCPDDVKDILMDFYKTIDLFIDGDEKPFWNTYSRFIQAVRKHLHNKSFAKGTENRRQSSKA